jgi:uncharacterized protein
MLSPDLHVASVTDVTVAWLRQRGVVGRPRRRRRHPRARRRPRPRARPGEPGWPSLLAAGLRVGILSNGTARRVADLGLPLLGVPAIALAGKPFGFAFRRALRTLGTTAGTTAMVGDQLFTDVLGARCAGLTSVLVAPLTPGRHAHTRVARRLERWVLAGGDRGRPLDR